MTVLQNMIWLLCQVRFCGLSFIQYLSAMINTFRYSYRKKEGMADKLDGMGDTVLFNDLFSMVNELLKRNSYDCPYDQIDCITHENDKMLGELEELVLEVNDIVISNSFKPHQNDDIQKLITECKYYNHKT